MGFDLDAVDILLILLLLLDDLTAKSMGLLDDDGDEDVDDDDVDDDGDDADGETAGFD